MLIAAMFSVTTPETPSTTTFLSVSFAKICMALSSLTSASLRDSASEM